MSIDQVFCTSEQGKRLKELLPGLTSAMVWFVTPSIQKLEPVTNYTPIGSGNYVPALTLQELRDVARNTVSESWASTFFEHLFEMTAPELADWVIERLEGDRTSKSETTTTSKKG